MAQSIKCGKDPTVHSKFCLDCALKEPTAESRVTALKILFADIITHGRDEKEAGFPFLSIWSELFRNKTQPSQVKSYAQDLVQADLIKAVIDIVNKALDDRTWIRTHNRIVFVTVIILSNLAKVKEWHSQIYNAGAIPLIIRLIRGELTWFERFAAARVLYFLHFTFSKELIEACMDVAFEIFDVVYREYIKFPDERLFYHSELLTDGFHGGADWQSCMAMQWMDNTRCWLVRVLNEAAVENSEEAAKIICGHENFKRFYELVEIDLTLYHFGENEQTNRTFMDALSCLSHLSQTKAGRKAIINELQVCEMLRHTALTGMMVQHSAIEVVVNLYKDGETREKADEIFGEELQDLVEFQTFFDRRAQGKEFERYNVWEELVKNMSGETRPFKLLVAARAVAEQFQREAKMTKNEILQLSSKAKEFKNGGNKLIGSDVEAAVKEYNEGVKICPMSDTETRVALFSNISECYSRLKTKFAEDPEKSSYYNKLIIKYATRTQAIQWQHGKTLWKRGKAFLDEKLWKAAYTEMYFFTRFGPMEPKVSDEFNTISNIAVSEVHPYKFLLLKYGPIAKATTVDEGPLWTRQEQVQCPRFVMLKKLIESRNKEVVPQVVLTRSDGPSQEEMKGNTI